MFGAQTRNQRTIVIFVGVLIFLSIFVGLVYNHLDSIQLPSRYVRIAIRSMWFCLGLCFRHFRARRSVENVSTQSTRIETWGGMPACHVELSIICRESFSNHG